MLSPGMCYATSDTELVPDDETETSERENSAINTPSSDFLKVLPDLQQLTE